MWWIILLAFFLGGAAGYALCLNRLKIRAKAAAEVGALKHSAVSAENAVTSAADRIRKKF